MSPSSRSFRIPELSRTQQHIAREMKARGNKCLTCEKPSFVVLMSLWAIRIYLLPPFSLEILFNNGGPTECWLETSTTKLCEQMEIVLSLCSCWFWFRSTIAKPSWWLIYQHAATGRNVFANSHRTYFHKGFVSWSIILPSLCRFASRCWFWKADFFYHFWSIRQIHQKLGIYVCTPTGKLIFTLSQVNPNDIICCLFVLK
jgi:hypothetical protein